MPLFIFILVKTLCSQLLRISLLATPWSLRCHVSVGCWKMSCLCRHCVSLGLAQLSATIFRKEGLAAWPQLMQLLQHSTHSPQIPEREVPLHCWQEGGTTWLNRPAKLFFPILVPGQMGLLLLSVVVASQPEAFQPHHRELLRLLNETLVEVGSPALLFYSLRTLTSLAPYLGTNDTVRHGPSLPWLCILRLPCPHPGWVQGCFQLLLWILSFLSVKRRF